MLSWILGSSAMVFIITLVVVVLWFKYPNARRAINTIVVCVFAVILVGGTVYCANQLNIYYNAKGGVYGYLTSFFGGNSASTQTKDGNFEISISNIEFRDNGGGEYRIAVNADKFDLEKGKYYTLFVNGAPATTSNFSYASKYISATYSYNFYNSGAQLLCNDTLKINIAFNDSFTTIDIKTSSKEASEYWSSLFNKRNFNLQVKAWGHEKDSKLTYGDGEVDKFYYVDYKVNGKKYISEKVVEGDSLSIFNLVGVKNVKANGVDITSDFVVTQDVTVDLTFYSLSELISQNNIKILAGNNGKLLYAMSTLEGLVYYDQTKNEYQVLSLNGQFDDTSSFSGGVFEMIPVGSDEKIKLYAEELKTFAEIDSNVTLHKNFANANVFKTVYINRGAEGIYMKNHLTGETKTLYASETWTDFKVEFNESSGYSSKFTAHSQAHRMTYDFILESLSVD